MKRATLFLMCAGLTQAAVFTSGPDAIKSGSQVTISFAVSQSTDVEVAVLANNGTVVRHLAAGVLGGTYDPPHPLKPGLSQTLTWDLTDDDGLLQRDARFRVRVRLGVLPAFDTTFDCHDIFPSTYLFYPGGLNPLYTYRPATDAFLSMKSYNGTPLYEQEQRVEISACNITNNILVNGVADGQGLGANSATVFRIDGKTGKVLHVINGTGLIFDSTAHYPGQGRANYDWEGKYYYYRCANNVYRFDLLGNPAPWPQTGTHVVKGFPFNDIGSAGITAGPDSSAYVIHYTAHDTIFPQCVSKIKNGVVVKSRFIQVNGSLAGGIRVDRHGNIFLGARVKELGRAWPSFIPDDSLSGDLCSLGTSQKAWAYEMYGSVVKFDSTGGSILAATTGADVLAGGGFHPGNCATWQNYHKCKTQGMVWMHYGMSHILLHTTYRITKCWCNQTRLDVDGYGRVFYPNTFMSEFCALDNNRNQIFAVKNRDVPEVAVGVGGQVEVTDQALYWVDTYNSQIVRFDWKADSEWVSPEIEGAGVSVSPLAAGAGSMALRPNPFNASTRISLHFEGVIPGGAALHVFNTDGKKVADLSKELRNNADGLDWKAGALPAGVYFVRLSVGNYSMQKQAVLLR